MQDQFLKFSEDIIPELHEMEKNITYMVFKDFTNHLIAKKIIDPDEFLDKDMTLLYRWAETLYTKYSCNTLSYETIHNIIDKSSASEDKKEILKLHIEELFLLSKSEYEIDLTTELVKYRKQKGLLMWGNTMNSFGGMEGFLKKMSQDIDMNPEDIRNYIVLLTQDMFKSINDSESKAIYLEEGLDDFINNKIMNKAFGTGIPQKFTNLLSSTTKGIQKGVNLFGSFSGKGKTTWLWLFYILPTLLHEDEEGNMKEKIFILANEQEADIFQLMYLFAVISTILMPMNKNTEQKFSTISRDRIASNKATKKDQEFLNIASNYILEHFSKRIKFEYISGFNPEKIELTVARWSKLGYDNFVFDTMKAERVDKYGDYIAMVTLLESLSKAHGIRAIVTIQLALDKQWRRYLDEGCIANAKGIITVAENCLLFREVDYSELGTLTVKNFVKQEDGKYKYEELDNKWIKPQSEMMKGEKYLMFFLGKNRHGDSNKVFIYRCNFDRMWLYEIGEVIGLENDAYKEKTR